MSDCVTCVCGMVERKTCLVVNLRKVNMKLYSNAYRLPQQDSILQAIGGCSVFASMDIIEGFFQQSVVEADKWKTTFVTPHRGIERLTVATMGLANFPEFFQYCMEDILRPYLWNFALVYIDDILVFSHFVEEHKNDLDQVL